VSFFAAVLASSNSSTLNDVEPGLLGFLVVAGMGIVLVFLLRSMNKQFRKLPPPEDPDGEGPGGGGEDVTAGGPAPQDTKAEGAKRG
jgi:hypothetical protein